jgi:hypothetical protein
VALWKRWPSLWPEWFAEVEAPNAFMAVVLLLMRQQGLVKVAYAAANAKDGSLNYRCCDVRLRSE